MKDQRLGILDCNGTMVGKGKKIFSYLEVSVVVGMGLSPTGTLSMSFLTSFYFFSWFLLFYLIKMSYQGQCFDGGRYIITTQSSFNFKNRNSSNIDSSRETFELKSLS